VKIRFNVCGYVDRRGPRELGAAQALEQARADKALEDLWLKKVAENVKEQRRIRRQA
jgi:hypothetical protein